MSMSISDRSQIGAAIALGLALAAHAPAASASELAVSVVVPLAGPAISDDVASSAEPRAMSMGHRDGAKLPEGRAAGGSDKQGRAFGSWGLPYTTRGAYSSARNGIPTRNLPFSVTGRLVMTYSDGSSSSCTASVIRKGLIVTAAHCVWAYGFPGSGATSVRFEPARFGPGAAGLPFGSWDGMALVVPSVFQNGTDACSGDPQIRPFACANDIAIVVMAPNSDGKLPAQVVGQYRESTDPAVFGYFLGLTVAQITQLGYPRRFDDGLKMIRTDSMGFMCWSCNLLRIGSDMTQGSSGGPWLLNFGIKPETDVPAGQQDRSNLLIGVTGWGYLDEQDLGIKIMGASRFGTNARYPTKANITDLIDTACATYPGKC